MTTNASQGGTTHVRALNDGPQGAPDLPEPPPGANGPRPMADVLADIDAYVKKVGASEVSDRERDALTMANRLLAGTPLTATAAHFEGDVLHVTELTRQTELTHLRITVRFVLRDGQEGGGE